MSRGKIFLGVIAGLAAGSLIGILFAPDKGSATRKKIVDKSGEYVGDIKEKLSSIIHNGHKRAEKVSATM